MALLDADISHEIIKRLTSGGFLRIFQRAFQSFFLRLFDAARAAASSSRWFARSTSPRDLMMSATIKPVAAAAATVPASHKSGCMP